jgi:hypothetical protein
MRLLLILIIVSIGITGHSQTFHRTYNFGQGGGGMSLALHDEGIVLNALEHCPYVCTHVMVLSSEDGEVLADRYFQDYTNEYRITAQHSNVRVGDRYYTSGDYQTISNLETDLMLLIYDENLDSVRLATYRDSTLRTFGWTLVAKEDKIYSWGVAGVDNQFYHGLLVCSDLDGELLWMKRYRDDYRFSLRGSITNSHDGHLITTVRGRPHNEKNRGVVRKIDTEGNVLWKKEYAFNSSPDFYEITLNKLGSDKYILIYHPDTTIINWEDTTWVSKPAMAYILDEDGELINTQVAAKPFQLRWYKNVEPTKDGGAIASGHVQIGMDLHGLLTRFDSLGNLIWDKWYRHNDFIIPGIGIPDRFEGRFNKSIELPDGRLAATGVIMTPHLGTVHTWVVLLDSMGCLEPGCADGVQVMGDVSSTEPVSPTTSGMRLAPNPAQQQVRVFLSETITQEAVSLTLYDMMGRQVLHQPYNGGEVVTVELHSLTPGLYILQVQGRNGRRWTEKLIVE